MGTETALRRENDDQHCLSTAQAEELLTGAPWRRFLVIGDEVADGRGEPAEGYGHDGWAHRVAACLRRVQPGLAYLNLGRKGRLAAEIRSRQLGLVLEFKPDLTALTCCGAELVRDPFDADSVEAEFDRVVAPLRDSGGDVLLVNWFDITRFGPRPSEEAERLRLRLRELAERKQAVALRHGAIYVNLAEHPAAADRDVYGADGSAPTMRGHAIAAASVIQGLGAHLTGAADECR
ncbi:SGNH/GDSL hydrolase family protein [Streptomyces sp. NPDC002698]|uniref:SGNH/GDSL hydrolase family protein n=1 Tax=Streptomyces sp. NPDC002698 TaxID=3364660 RepID=UPI00368A9A78